MMLRDDDGTVREIEVDAEVRTRSPIDDERRASVEAARFLARVVVLRLLFTVAARLHPARR